MPDDRDEIAVTLKRIIRACRERSHATSFHAPRDLKPNVEVDTVSDWAAVVNKRYGWDIRNIRKNHSPYPDCLADWGERAASRPAVAGVEVDASKNPSV